MPSAVIPPTNLAEMAAQQAIPNSITSYLPADGPFPGNPVPPHQSTLIPGPEVINRMANDMRELVKKIQDLRHLGIEDSQIALPKICVVGDQSTGKSSLIEGMSEIKVPRSAGTCTRCPMEINLSESASPWKCKISLSKGFIFNPKQSLTKISKTKPLGPWHSQDPQEEHFITLTRKDQVQEAIQCAQLAILNPQNDSAQYASGFLSSVDKTYTRVKFSPNVVRLDISAPGFPNLAFYDLPGVISQAEVESEAYLVTLVENLVRHYVSQENCIILLTLPMTDDATNSSAARIVREIKATHRTLGVLTKPDRVEDIGQWADLLNGHKFSLGKGYYVVRNNPDPSVENHQARLEEEQFFAGPPWTCKLGMFQNRFGTRSLQNALSDLLLDQIKKSLPHVIKQINDKAERIKQELQYLPEPVSQNTLYILCSKLQELNNGILTCIDGGSKDMPMLKVWNHIASDFCLALKLTRPTLKMETDEDVFEKKGENEGDSDCEVVGAYQASKRKVVSVETKPAMAKPPATHPNAQFLTEHFTQFKTPAHRFELTEIRETNEDYSVGGMHHQIHPGAIEALNMKSVSHWGGPMAIFLNATNKLVKRTILDQVNKVFAPYRDTELHRQVSAIVVQHLAQLRDELEGHASELYDLEKSKPFTMSFEYMGQQERLHQERLASRRHFVRARRYLEAREELPADPQKARLKIQQLDFGQDSFEKEIKMMAHTRAYYDVAASRFVDSLCQNVHMKLLSKCKNLYSVIEEKLGINGDDPMALCGRLMAQDPERQRRREYLLKEQVKLATAQRWLTETTQQEDDYGMNYDDDFMKKLSSHDEDDKSKVFK